MKLNKIYIAFCLSAIALFFAGRCTAPRAVAIDNKHQIDSLTRASTIAHKRALIAEELARKAYERGINHQKAKVIFRTVYMRDTAKNHAMKHEEKDSVIKKILNVPLSDSSYFTTPVANGILDLGSENHRLKLNAYADSLSNASMKEAFGHMEIALIESGNAGEAKNQIIIEERETNKKLRKQIRRQKVLKWLAVSGIFVVSTVAISK